MLIGRDTRTATRLLPYLLIPTYRKKDMSRLIKLPERLDKIAAFIEKGASVVDVGSDHGLLPVYLAQSGLATRIIASDISPGSLGAARRAASKHGVVENIEFIETPGLDGIADTMVDTIVIAGMGGQNIASIICEAPWVKKRKVRLILQPQSKTDELCGFLRSTGYSLRDAEIVRDRGRYYIVIVASSGRPRSSLSPEMELYSKLAAKKCPLLTKYIDMLITKTQSAAASVKNSDPTKYETLHKRLTDLRNIREL